MTKVLMIVALVLGVQAARAQYVNITLADKYTTRGIVCNRDPVLQSMVDASLTNGLSIMVWENTDLTDIAGAKNHATEVDVIPHWYHTVSESLAIDIGAAQYEFPNTEYDGTYELYAKAINPMCYFTFWYDVDVVDSWYSSVGITPTESYKQFDIGWVALLGFAGDRYNEFYFGSNETALNDLTVKAWGAWKYKIYQLRADIGHTWLPDTAIREGAEELYGQGEANTASISFIAIF